MHSSCIAVSEASVYDKQKHFKASRAMDSDEEQFPQFSLYPFVFTDEFEDRFKGVNVTAYNLRKNLLDPLSEYTCNSDNSTGCNRTSIRGMDFRGRAINLNSRGGLDLVFVIDASSSVRKLTDFKNGLEFAKELVRTIGSNNRYD